MILFKYGDNSAHFQTLLEDIQCVVHKKNLRKCQECKKGVEKEVDVQTQAGLMPVESVSIQMTSTRYKKTQLCWKETIHTQLRFSQNITSEAH